MGFSTQKATFSCFFQKFLTNKFRCFYNHKYGTHQPKNTTDPPLKYHQFPPFCLGSISSIQSSNPIDSPILKKGAVFGREETATFFTWNPDPGRWEKRVDCWYFPTSCAAWEEIAEIPNTSMGRLYIFTYMKTIVKHSGTQIVGKYKLYMDCIQTTKASKSQPHTTLCSFGYGTYPYISHVDGWNLAFTSWGW